MIKRFLLVGVLVLLGIILVINPTQASTLRSTSFEPGSSWDYSLDQKSSSFDTTTTTPRDGSYSLEARGNGSGTCCKGDTIVFDSVDVSSRDTIVLTFHVQGESSLEDPEFVRSWILDGSGNEVTPGDHYREQGWNEASENYLESTGWIRVYRIIPASLDQAKVRIELGSDNSGGNEGIFVDDVQLREIPPVIEVARTGFEPGNNLRVDLTTSSTPTGTFDTTTTDPRSGSYSLEANDLDVTANAVFEDVDVSTSDTGYVAIYGKFPDTYESGDYLKAWIVAKGGGDTVPDGDLSLNKRFFGAEGVGGSSSHWLEGSNLPSGYNRYLIPFTAGADTVQLKMEMENNAEQFFIDDVAFYDATNVAPNIDLKTPKAGDVVSGSDIPGTYTITDRNIESGTITVEVSDDSGTNFDTVATINGSTDNVLADNDGETYVFQWDSLVDLGNTYDTQVKLRIRATDGEETGSYDTSGAFTVDNLIPPTINDLESTGSITTPDTGVFLTWTGNGSDGDFFQIYRSERTADTSKATRIDTVDYRSDTVNYQDNTVTKGDSYFYYVTTVDTAGNESDSSNESTSPVVNFVKRDTGVKSYRPGDTLTYRIEVSNKGFGPTDNLELVDAIPRSTTLADSAEVVSPPPSADIDYSPDNGSSWQKSSFPRKDIDQIRWTITANLQPRQSGTSSVFRFIVRIN